MQAIFAVTFALLVDEILLSSIFHVLIGGGNTVTAISVAMLGLSSAGIIAYLVPAFSKPDRATDLYHSLILWFGVAQIISTFVIMSVPVNHAELAFSRGDPRYELIKLGIYFVSTMPFFVGGLVINVILRNYSERISHLYFSDLSGAALGCIASPILLTTMGAPRGIILAAIPAIVIGGISVFRRNMIWKILCAIPVFLVAVTLVSPEIHSFKKLNTMGDVDDPQHRSFSIKPGDIDYERWALDAWTIIRNQRIPQQWEHFRGWGLSETYDGEIPDIKLINYNARFSTYVTASDGDLEKIGEWLDADLISQHYLLGRTFDSVLVIGAGGGREVLNALHHGATRIDAIDISDVVVEDIMKNRLLHYSGGLYEHPYVTALADEGRSYVERSEDTYDLIDFSIVGGMNLEKMDLVRIDDLFTAEGLRSYFNHLSDEGIFSYVMYTFRTDIVDELARKKYLTSLPYIPALKTLSGLRTVFEESFPDKDFRNHVLVSGLPGMVSPDFDLAHIIVSKRAFSDKERQRFLDRNRDLKFLSIYPRTGEETSSGLYPDIIESPDLQALMASLPFSIAPSTDDIPFNFAFDWNHIRKAYDNGVLIAFLAGNPLVSTAINMTFLAIGMILVPLIVMTVRNTASLHLSGSWPLLLMFACLGFGFMAIEIAVLLKLQLYLGKPIYGLSVGLFSFLFFSGLGAHFTNRFHYETVARSLYKATGVLMAAGLLIYSFGSDLYLNTIHLPIQARMVIAAASIFPMAFVMGIFFPVGIKLVSEKNRDLIPWVWAINGCFSVIGIFGTRIVALFLGFGQSILMGLLLYLGVVLCVFSYQRTSRRIS